VIAFRHGGRTRSVARIGDMIDATEAPDRVDGEMRVADLSAATGVSVRNIRAYQDRGLLPAPRREGRIVWYNAAHVERLAVITSLLERGFSSANIAELLAGWSEGSTVADVVGLGQRFTGSFSDEVPDVGPAATIVERYELDVTDGASLGPIVDAGLIEVDGVEWRVPSPRLLRAGVELRAAGVPLEELLEELARVRQSMQVIATDMVALVHRNVWAPHIGDHLPSLPTIVEVAEIVDRIRPLATTVVTVELARALQASADAVVAASITRLVHPD